MSIHSLKLNTEGLLWLFVALQAAAAKPPQDTIVGVRRLSLRRKGLFAVALAFFCLTEPLSSQADTTILTGTVAPGPDYWPLYVGQDLGYFKAGGVNLEVYSSGGTVAQQLVANAVDIACSGFPDFMRATYQGASVKMFENSIGVPPFTVYAKPAIKTAASLKGKTISIGDIHDASFIYVSKLLASVDLKPSDVNFVYAKAAGARFSALAAGAIDATLLNPPTSFRAAARGFRNVGEISSLMNDFPFTVWAVNTNWSVKNDAALTAFAKAYLRATKWLYNPLNEKRAIGILVKDARLSQQDARSSYNYMVTQLHAFSSNGVITQVAFSKMKNALLQLGNIQNPVPPLSAFYDPAVMKAASGQ